MISVVLAILAATCNATASVLQRRAAVTVPQEDAFRLSLIWALLRRPVWLGGIAALIGGFVFQAGALTFGGLALVQPLLVVELPITMILVAVVFGVRLDRRSWGAILMLTAGLTVLLASAAPGQGRPSPAPLDWILATVATVGFIVALITVARLSPSSYRAALLGVATGLGFAFTAALMKEATRLVDHPLELLTTWPVYAMVVAGLCSVYLLQNTLHSGTLVAAQPALTTSDPVASIIFGVLLFDERVRSGAWIVPEVLGAALILYGSVLLARSPALHGSNEEPDDVQDPALDRP